MIYSSKNFRKNSYYCLYTLDDDIVCYLANYEEVLNLVDIPLYEIVRKFKNKKEFINVIIDNKKYKLYAYSNLGGLL